jgi:adenine-specific DNA-methyltransferase
MKYMGSKRAMLGNGLGELLGKEVPIAHRFVDLFTGSAAVATHVGSRFDLPVLAFDLQSYSTVLAGAIIGRNETFVWKPAFDRWYKRAEDFASQVQTPEVTSYTKKAVAEYRAWCAEQHDLPITKAYGGHYFSPQQAVWIDALRKKLPSTEPVRTVALAALIQSASQSAAAPGHTAQPFQPTPTAKRFLEDAWKREIPIRTRIIFEALANQCAQCVGSSRVADANDAAEELIEGDLVFLDPPYSGVHYSRFYHVLETIAQGSCGEVSGVGRYPAPVLRPRSSYSVTSESTSALNGLLKTISARGARAILTFPDHECSNGLSGKSVREISNRYFRVKEKTVKSKFSTMGGTGNAQRNGEGLRSARHHADELILVLDPK